MFAGRQLLVALEGEADYITRLQDRLGPAPSVHVMLADITDSTCVPLLQQFGIDSAMSFNVFEHIGDDQTAMRNVCEALPTGGTFVLFVPASMKIYGPMDRQLGHHRRYTGMELRSKLERAGFQLRILRHVNSLGFFAWFVSSRLHRDGGFRGGTGAVAAYDRYVIPVVRAAERRLAPPFGQSLLAVAVKPTA